MKSAIPEDEEIEEADEVEDDDDSLRPSIKVLCLAKFPVDWDSEDGLDELDEDITDDDPNPSADEVFDVDIDGDEIVILELSGPFSGAPFSGASEKVLIHGDLLVTCSLLAMLVPPDGTTELKPCDGFSCTNSCLA